MLFVLPTGFLSLQTDKQRIIWAYKILFLDVLFPLNLRKVIFVDSDQIIRADFAELWYMDLQASHRNPTNQEDVISKIKHFMILPA